MGNTTNRQASIESRRIALEREISIRVPRFDSFVTEYSANISTTGMFIVSENPQPPGTSFSFEFSVADDWKLIRGRGQVVWTRYRDEGGERPAGMGVRFIELDAQSRRLIRWIVEKHIREGGKPFELDELKTVVDEAIENVLDESSEEPSESVRERPAAAPRPQSQPRAVRPTVTMAREEHRVLPLVLTAVGILAVVGALFWLTEWLPQRSRIDAQTIDAPVAQTPESAPESGSPSGESEAVGVSEPADEVEEARPGESTAAEAEETPASPVTVTAPAEPAVAEPEPPSSDAPIGSAYKAVSETIGLWASAWSDRDVDQYLSFYSSSFQPPAAASLEQWRAQRRERLTTPAFIKVSVSGLDIDRTDRNHVRAVFLQSYRSDRFSDSVQKTLELVWEAGSWKIEREASG
jgi:uncharacterized protein (TIGR02266 family)